MSKLTRPRIVLTLASFGVAILAAIALLVWPKAKTPSPITLQGRATGTKTLALTFTDGPNTTYTPQILGILGKYKTRSTFVMSGGDAMSRPTLVRRILREGHQIAVTSAGDRTTIEKITGKNPRLVFVPSDNDVDPRDDRLGVNRDGSGDPRTPDQIVAAVLWQLSQGGRTNVLHLRDGGVDRSLTVASLDLLLPKLQERGYQLVTGADLVGLAKTDVLPPKQSVNPWGSRSMTALLIGGLLFGLVQVGLMAPKPKKRLPNYRFRPTVSILIPAYNIEDDIRETVRCMLESDFKVSEIVVVDDGSSDETFLEVVTKFAGEPRLHILRQEHSGRRGALNQAMKHARGDIVLCIDGGVAVSSNAVGALVAYLHDPEVGAAFAGPPVSHLLRKRDPDISAWRKSAVVEAGGWMDTDMELAEKLRAMGWSTVLRPARHATESLIPINLPSETDSRASLK
jgi:peptidoglycan/xylan/chitin deacetylase (PgdA/CDA1 family)